MGLGSGLGKNARVTIAFDGDSETAGFGSTSGGPTRNIGYRHLLCQLAQVNGINLMSVGDRALPPADANTRQPYSNGLSGDSIAGVTGRILAQPDLFPEIRCLKIGTNDAMQQILTPAQMAALLFTCIQTSWLIGQRPGTNKTNLIIVAKIPDTYTGTNVAAMHQTTIDYNALIPGVVAACVALGMNVKMIDLYNPLGVSDGLNPNFSPNSVPHQSDAGYIVEAPIWFGVPGSGLICDYKRIG